MPWDRVPSTPARAAEATWNASVVWECRAAWSASCLLLGSELHRPGTRLGLGTACAYRAHGTMGRVKLDGDQLLAPVLDVLGGSPPATAMPLGTRDGLCHPINATTRDIEALRTAGLPTGVGQHRPHEFHGMREAAAHQVVGSDRARIQQVFTREQVMGSEMGMHDGRQLDVCGRGWCRFDVGDEMGAPLITGLGQVDLLPRPVCLPLRRVAGVNIVGGANEERMRGQILGGAPAYLGRGCVILLHPDPAQHLDGRPLPEPHWGGGRLDRCEEMEAVSPNGFRQRLALLCRGGEPRVFQPLTRAVKPVGGDLAPEPVMGDGRQVMQGMPHGLPDTGQPMQGPDGCQDMRRVGALPAPGLQQAALLQAREERITQYVLGMAREEPGAKLAQHGSIKAGVLSGQRSGILPINAAPDMLCRLAIREPLETWQDGDKGKAGRIESWLPQGRKQVGKVGGLEQGPQGIADAHKAMALWKDGRRDTGGVSRDRWTLNGCTQHGNLLVGRQRGNAFSGLRHAGVV